jgi:hypothetical protein
MLFWISLMSWLFIESKFLRNEEMSLNPLFSSAFHTMKEGKKAFIQLNHLYSSCWCLSSVSVTWSGWEYSYSSWTQGFIQREVGDKSSLCLIEGVCPTFSLFSAMLLKIVFLKRWLYVSYSKWTDSFRSAKSLGLGFSFVIKTPFYTLKKHLKTFFKKGFSHNPGTGRHSVLPRFHLVPIHIWVEWGKRGDFPRGSKVTCPCWDSNSWPSNLEFNTMPLPCISQWHTIKKFVWIYRILPTPNHPRPLCWNLLD